MPCVAKSDDAVVYCLVTDDDEMVVVCCVWVMTVHQVARKSMPMP